MNRKVASSTGCLRVPISKEIWDILGQGMSIKDDHSTAHFTLESKFENVVTLHFSSAKILV